MAREHQARPEAMNEARHEAKFVFVTGGVVSSLGKGITTSSVGALLRARGYRVTAVKIPVRNDDKQAFIDFVLAHYIRVGVEELDKQKLTPLLLLKYHDSIADAVADLGRPEEIGSVFSGFQKYLYV